MLGQERMRQTSCTVRFVDVGGISADTQSTCTPHHGALYAFPAACMGKLVAADVGEAKRYMYTYASTCFLCKQNAKAPRNIHSTASLQVCTENVMGAHARLCCQERQPEGSQGGAPGLLQWDGRVYQSRQPSQWIMSRQ